MATIAEAFDRALKLHQAGDLDGAQRLYQEVLKADPQHANAWHLSGLIANSREDYATALAAIGRAIELDPNQAGFHNHLGEVYRALGKNVEAEACCREAIRLKPDLPAAHNTLGVVLSAQDQSDAAIVSFRRALALDPNFAQAHFNLGTALQAQGQLDEAITAYRDATAVKPDYAVAYDALGTALRLSGQANEAADAYRQAIALAPDFAQAHCNLGIVLNHQGQVAEATASFERALELAELPEAHFNLGTILQAQGQLDAAADRYRAALRLAPHYAQAHSNLGTIHRANYEFAEAIECYQRALEFRPDFAETLSNLGNIFKLQGRTADALICYDQALRISPEIPLARYNRALMSLADGDFERGWELYESRWDCSDSPRRAFEQPQWDGSPLAGRTLLVHAEQGIGDTLQFARYLKLLDNAAEVYFELPAQLIPLFQQSGFRRLVARDTALPRFDLHTPLLSLPGALGTRLETIPADVPYLSASAERIAAWRPRIRATPGFKVGIAWQGRPTYRDDRLRSISLRHFAPLAQTGVELISLQKGLGTEQLAGLPATFPVTNLGPELDQDGGAFADTAAVLKSVDLLITSDSAIAHLAGALGIPVWVALPLVPDWRWLYERTDSPWYPTMRLFRQTQFSDWPSVFARMASELRRLASAGSR